MKRPTMLVEAILRNAEIDLDLSVERDVATIRRRCEHEGLSFLTIVLPTLSDALEQGLESGLLSCPTAFSRHGSLPRLLGGFFRRVFALDGSLLDDACPYAVKYIRQICRFFKKLKKGCSPLREQAAAEHFVEVEAELRMMTAHVERKDFLLDTISGIIWSQVFPEVDPLDLVCHHGPGATAERLGSNERFRIRNWNSRSELLFPSDLHCYPNYRLAAEVGSTGKEIGCVEGVDFLDIKDEPSVRVVFVPKTQLTPRVIAIEPSHVQYMQQSLKDYVYRILETHRLTKNSIRFSRQDFNQRLAYSGSIDRRLATLDLKDASDRVHLHLVQRIFKTSGILEYLEDCRSVHATLPDSRNIVLSKFASMGSAMCFPVEAMVFYTLAQCAMHQLDGTRPTSSSIRRYSSMIDIYGDDIIVPVEYADVVVRYLESYALKVNVNKSFSKGNFRESCGADYFKGVPVNPVYARKVPHDNSRDWEADDVMSWNATADHFYIRGQWHVCQVIRDMLSRVAKTTIPRSREFGSGLVHHSLIFTTRLRFDRNLQCWRQRRIVFEPAKKKDQIDGSELACLNKWGLHSLGGRQGDELLGKYTAGHRYGNTDVRGTCSEVFVSNNDDSDSNVGLQTVEHRTVLDRSSLCPISAAHDSIEEELLLDASMAVAGTGLCQDLCTVRTREESGLGCPGWLTADHYLTEVASDPLKHLMGDSIGLDFLSSTKRGVFKSKRRWISLAG